MKTKIEIIDELNMNMNVIDEAARVIRNGGLVVFPTETVYGLGSNSLNEEAVKKIFIAKGRPQDNPLIIHVGDKNIDKYVLDVPEIAKKLMDAFWPGPLTIILKKKPIVPDLTSANLDTVGIRMPNNKIALELIKRSGVPLAAPSANISGRPSPTDVKRCIEDLNGRVDYILGGIRSEVGLESTIIDCTVIPPCVLRPGGISIEELKMINESIYIDSEVLHHIESKKPKAPGMKYRHYAPNAHLMVVQNGNLNNTINKIKEIVKDYEAKNKKVGIIATDETINLYKHKPIISIGSRQNLSEVGKNLFEVLRTFDDLKVDIILSESFPNEGIGFAVMNRLRKAASTVIHN